MSTENSTKTIAFAFLVCLVASVVVSTIAVALRSTQERNKVLDRQKNVLFAAGILQPGSSVTAEEIGIMFSSIRIKAVDIKTGDVLENFETTSYDQKKAGKDVAASEVLPAKDDIALIKRREKVGLIYEQLDTNGEVERVIIPIKGYGLWSTMYGFLALSKTADVIEGITFYEHAETPGLGGEIDNASWKASWKGKIPYGKNGEVAVTVVKGITSGGSPTKVDGLSGATITSKGVDNLIKFWLGQNGYGKYIKKYVLAGS